MTALKRGSEIGTIVVLVLSQMFPYSILAAPNPSSVRSLSLNKTGYWGKNQEAVYPELVRRVQKWIENIEALDVKVSPSSNLVKKADFENDRLRLNLTEATERLRKALLVGSNRDITVALLSELRNSRARAAGRSDLGEEIQAAWFVEAAHHWVTNNELECRRALERAVRIHPLGQVPSILEWDQATTETFPIDSFESFVSRVQAEQVRSCELNLAPNAAVFKAKINGFPSGRGTSVNLVPGDVHHIEIQAPGYEVKKEKVSCDRPGKKRVVMVLKKQKDAAVVKEFNQRDLYEGKSMILIEPFKDQFKLMLYTPGRDFDELPTRYPIRISDMGSDYGSSTGPIATDAALAIFEKHKVLASDLRSPYLVSNSGGNLNYRTENEQTQTVWFKSPVFWGVVGGLMLGGAITYFSNRKTSSTSSDWE